jgi:ribonuclease HII
LSVSDKTQSLYEFDRELRSGEGIVLAGVDEAGRGPLAGPVVAAAVCLDHNAPINGIDDSKKLTEAKRELLYRQITSQAAWAVGMAAPEEIDRINILQATLCSMKRALDGLKKPWSLALIDGNQRVKSLEPSRQRCIVGGDAKSASIAAASIIAKVTRDRIMKDLDRSFPGYDFSVHKGYGTAAHRAHIIRIGLCEIHRKTFCRRLTKT